MSLRFVSLLAGAAGALAALSFAPRDALACGGCFHPEDQPETTVVTAHRMALAISTTQTVLWDQVQYAGAPEEFAWVLPIRPGGRVELSTDAWFEALDAATSTRVVGPPLNCNFGDGDGSRSGCGCGMDEYGASDLPAGGEPNAPPPVTVVHEGTVGPYETVTLRSEVPGALTTWLVTHGFAIGADVKPIIDAYTAEGFDFIALRLAPNQGVQQMKPVRVVSPGAVPALPLRMVAAGTGANVAITLFVIGEGRWETGNFPNGLVNRDELSWDFNDLSSNYSELREELFAKDGGRTWINAFAKRGALLSRLQNPLNGAEVQYALPSISASTIGELYAGQGLVNKETSTNQCTQAFSSFAGSTDLVVNVCAPGPDGGGSGGSGGDMGGGGAGGDMGGGGGAGAEGGGEPGEECGVPKAGEIDARLFACGPLDDMAVALTGMHPRDVWLTRLESQLPRAALGADLTIQAAVLQTEVENWLLAAKATNAPCPTSAAAMMPLSGDKASSMSVRRKTDLALLAAGLLLGLSALARRALRRPALALAGGGARRMA